MHWLLRTGARKDVLGLTFPRIPLALWLGCIWASRKMEEGCLQVSHLEQHILYPWSDQTHFNCFMIGDVIAPPPPKKKMKLTESGRLETRWVECPVSRRSMQSYILNPSRPRVRENESLNLLAPAVLPPGGRGPNLCLRGPQPRESEPRVGSLTSCTLILDPSFPASLRS